MLSSGKLGDLLDTLRIQNIVRIECIKWRLFEVIDRSVFQRVTIEISTNRFNNRVLKFVSLLVQIDKFKLFTDGL